MLTRTLTTLTCTCGALLALAGCSESEPIDPPRLLAASEARIGDLSRITAESLTRAHAHDTERPTFMPVSSCDQANEDRQSLYWVLDGSVCELQRIDEQTGRID